MTSGLVTRRAKLPIRPAAQSIPVAETHPPTALGARIGSAIGRTGVHERKPVVMIGGEKKQRVGHEGWDSRLRKTAGRD
jgi:hypothetical protein